MTAEEYSYWRKHELTRPCNNGWSVCPDCGGDYPNDDGSIPNCSDCYWRDHEEGE